jgi:hypothetical protein
MSQPRQFPVIGYALQISIVPNVSIQFQPGGPFTALNVNGPDEFMAIVALIQAPGRLLFDPQAATLQKVMP